MPRRWASFGRSFRTLSRLDRYAATPDRLDDVRAELSLGRLRYALHLASEHAYGVAPPPGAETAHAELRSSLAAARDATAEVAEALTDQGAEALEPSAPGVARCAVPSAPRTPTPRVACSAPRDAWGGPTTTGSRGR